MLKPVLTDHTFREIRDIIYAKCGIYIQDSKKYLIETRLVRVIEENGLGGFDEYLRLLKYSTNGDELSRLFDAITTNETYFYREPEQIEMLIENILPEIRRRHNSRRVRIWSAGCSSGEEPYTIAIMLKERGMNLREFEIIGTDICDTALNAATRAEYGSYSVRNVPPNIRQRYFMKNGISYILREEIKGLVRFKKINLIDDKISRQMQGMDIILCRNVLIYFDLRAKQRVVSSLYDCLVPGGYLCIGASESLHNVTRAFRPRVIEKAIFYQKS